MHSTLHCTVVCRWASSVQPLACLLNAQQLRLWVRGLVVQAVSLRHMHGPWQLGCGIRRPSACLGEHLCPGMSRQYLHDWAYVVGVGQSARYADACHKLFGSTACGGLGRRHPLLQRLTASVADVRRAIAVAVFGQQQVTVFGQQQANEAATCS